MNDQEQTHLRRDMTRPVGDHSEWSPRPPDPSWSSVLCVTRVVDPLADDRVGTISRRLTCPVRVVRAALALVQDSAGQTVEPGRSEQELIAPYTPEQNVRRELVRKWVTTVRLAAQLPCPPSRSTCNRPLNRVVQRWAVPSAPRLSQPTRMERLAFISSGLIRVEHYNRLVLLAAVRCLGAGVSVIRAALRHSPAVAYWFSRSRQKGA